MTVKSLSRLDKAYIVSAFNAKTMTINELARLYNRHRTTIIRVLEEAGVEPGIRRRKKAEPARIEVFEPIKKPWYSRVLDKISNFLFSGIRINFPRL